MGYPGWCGVVGFGGKKKQNGSWGAALDRKVLLPRKGPLPYCERNGWFSGLALCAGMAVMHDRCGLHWGPGEEGRAVRTNSGILLCHCVLSRRLRLVG